jgi:hypothetical protein
MSKERACESQSSESNIRAPEEANMKGLDRGSLVGALALIILGAVFLILNFIPDVGFEELWPVIFFVTALGFYLPAVIWPESRRGLAALYIPGSLMLVLGIAFLYNTLSGDWGVWAFAWLLIPLGIGLGMTLAAWIGAWAPPVGEVGIWIMVLNAVGFSLFGTLFGEPIIKAFAAGLVLVGGVLMLLRGFLRGRQAEAKPKAKKK